MIKKLPHFCLIGWHTLIFVRYLCRYLCPVSLSRPVSSVHRSKTFLKEVEVRCRSKVCVESKLRELQVSVEAKIASGPIEVKGPYPCRCMNTGAYSESVSRILEYKFSTSI